MQMPEESGSEENTILIVLENKQREFVTMKRKKRETRSPTEDGE